MNYNTTYRTDEAGIALEFRHSGSQLVSLILQYTLQKYIHLILVTCILKGHKQCLNQYHYFQKHQVRDQVTHR